MEMTATIQPHQPGTRHGFTLIELMVVVGIMGLITLFALPAFRGASRGGNLRAASLQLNSVLGLARQTSISTRQEVSVLFPGTDPLINYTDGNRHLAYRGYALYGEKDEEYLSEWRELPQGVVFSPNPDSPVPETASQRSVFMQSADYEKSVDFPRMDGTGVFDDQDMMALTFRPDGALQPADRRITIFVTDGYVDLTGTPTLVPRENATVLGLEVSPVTGQPRVREYAP